jgi:hypothetical protein
MRINGSAVAVDDDDLGSRMTQNIGRDGASQQPLPAGAAGAADDQGCSADTLGDLGDARTGNARLNDLIDDDRGEVR